MNLSQATGAARLKTLRPTGEGTGHTFGQAYDLGDASRPVDIHRIAGRPHGDSFPMICLPRDKLLIEAGACTPAAPNTPPPAVANLNNLNPIGRVVPLSALYAVAGKAVPR